MDADAPSFAKRLEALPDRDLKVLLSRRAEVAALAGRARPDWDELAAILAQPRSVALALTRLDRFLSQVLQLVCLAGGCLPAAAAEGLGRADLAAAAGGLQRWGLAFADADGALAVPTEVSRLVWNPGGLGAPAARLLENLTIEELRAIAMGLGLSGPELPKRKADLIDAVGGRLRDRETVAAVLRGAPAAARTELERLRRAGGSSRDARLGDAWRYPYVWWPDRERHGGDGPSWLLAHGIVLPEDAVRSSLAVPSEVERGLRGRVFARWEVAAPPLELGPLREEKHPVELVAALDSLVEAWRHSPPPALKEGGAPRREIRRAAGTIGWSEEAAAQLIALGFAAGLLRERELLPEKRSRSSRNPHVLQSRRAVIEVTEAIDGWSEAPEAERWLDLALIWMGSLGEAGPHEVEQTRERLVLDLLAEIEAGRGATAASIGAVLAWRHPAHFPDAAAGAALALAFGRAIGSLGAGGAEPAIGLNDAGGLAFLSRGSVDVAALGRAFPPVMDRCVVTADHRVVVSGLPSSALARLLVRIAEVVSVQPARVYRLTEAALGRALDGGFTAEQILGELRAHATSDVPQNVVALVEDVARRHGRLRVGEAGVYVVADDPALLEAVARSRGLGGALRRIAPTVAVIDGRDRGEVMAALRRAGLMPIADGSAKEHPPEARRERTVRASRPRPRRHPPAEPATFDGAAAARLVAALRSGPSARPSTRPAAGAEDEVHAALVEAARHRRRVEIGYQLASGAPSILTVAPFEVRGQQILAHDPVRFSYHAFDLRRVLWVEAAGTGTRSSPSDARPGALFDQASVAADDALGDDDRDEDDDPDDDDDDGDEAPLADLDRLPRRTVFPARRRRR